MSKKNDLQNDFQELLRASGLRSTGPRLQVLLALNKAQTPLSHNEMTEILADQGLDRTTIFRNLTDMSDAGILSRIDVGDHIWRFEIKSHHPHFVCTDCGDVECLPELDMNVSQKVLGKKARVGSVSEVLLKGHCEDCGD